LDILSYGLGHIPQKKKKGYIYSKLLEEDLIPSFGNKKK
jgi:hypothetical protein